MIKYIKNTFAKAEVKSLAEQHKAIVHFQNWAAIKDVLVLTSLNNTDQIKHLKTIFSLIKNEGKVPTVLAYYPYKELKDEMLVSHTIQFVSAKENNWKGLPVEAYNLFLKDKKFDLVIDVSTFQSNAIMWLALKSSAPLITGRYMNESFVDFELKIDAHKDETFLVEQILFYLRTIKSK